MDALEAIFTRRSIRKYTANPISEEILHELIRAATSAPSANNEQPWHFVIITERDILNEIPKFHEYAQMLRQAPAAILVCGDTHLVKIEGYWVQDCAAATQNILLAAHAKGIGAVWIGVYPTDSRVPAMRKLLGIPNHIVPFSLVSLGYPAEEKQPAVRFDKARIHSNRW